MRNGEGGAPSTAPSPLALRNGPRHWPPAGAPVSCSCVLRVGAVCPTTHMGFSVMTCSCTRTAKYPLDISPLLCCWLARYWVYRICMAMHVHLHLRERVLSLSHVHVHQSLRRTCSACMCMRVAVEPRRPKRWKSARGTHASGSARSTTSRSSARRGAAEPRAPRGAWPARR